MNYIKLQSIDESKNRKRGYCISTLQQGLFAPYVLEVNFGRIGSKGRTKTYFFDTEEELEIKLAQLLKIRKRHNYEITE